MTEVNGLRCVFSVPQLVHNGKLDFLVFDYLSEITMSLLTAAKAKMPVSPSICVVTGRVTPPLMVVLQ